MTPDDKAGVGVRNGQKTDDVISEWPLILLRNIGISQHEISRRCIRQTIRKFDRFHNVATKPGA